jgi:hypothetical protein
MSKVGRLRVVKPIDVDLHIVVAPHGPVSFRGHAYSSRPQLPVPAGCSWATRSVRNTWRDSACSRFSRRSARISTPPIGCTLGVPFLIRREVAGFLVSYSYATLSVGMPSTTPK